MIHNQKIIRKEALNMKNNNLQSIHHSSLKRFWEDYKTYVEKIHEENFIKTLLPKQIVMINKLDKYLVDTGFNKIATTLSNLESNKPKIKGFIDLYQYLLKTSENDFDKIIDLLFALPDQFEKEFREQGHNQKEKVHNEHY